MADVNPGDAEGRRLARRKASLLAEAGALAVALDVLLERAGFPAGELTELIKRIAVTEQSELLKATGRLESRKRFKHRGGHPKLTPRPVSLLFIDESGRSNPEPHLDDPVFALGAVAMSRETELAYVARADAVKLQFFGTTDITLHEPEIRHFEGRYGFGGDAKRQREFRLALDDLVAGTPFLAFGVAVRKAAFAEQFISRGIDPYLPNDVYAVAILMLLERYVDFLATSDPPLTGRITFESQGPKEDVNHQLDYASVLAHGTQWVPESAFRQHLEPGIHFTPKQGSDPMELADMFARDLFEWARGRGKEEPTNWALFGTKIYKRDDGDQGRFGVKVFPDSDIREAVARHRGGIKATN